MDNKRRKFLKMAGATVLAGISAPAIIKIAVTASSSPRASGSVWSSTCVNFTRIRVC